MKVKAVKVIRSSHLTNQLYLPGDVGEVQTERRDATGRKLLNVKWEKDGLNTVCLESDVEPVLEDASHFSKVIGLELALTTAIVAAPAATDSSAKSGEAASFSVRLHDLRPVRRLESQVETRDSSTYLTLFGNGGGI